VPQVVTGACGFIGSHLAERLLKEDLDVVAIDNFDSYYTQDIKEDNLRRIRERGSNSEGEFTFIRGSLLNDKKLEKLPRSPNHVFHLAAKGGVRNSVKTPKAYYRTNITGLVGLLEYLNSVDNFVFTSSSSVYGDVPLSQQPIDESKDLNPEVPYALTKSQGEEILDLFEELYGHQYTVVRPFGVYGPRQRPDEIFTKFIIQALEHDPVTIYGDGELSRDFTYVGDIARGMIHAAQKGDGIYNLGNGRRITINEVADVIEDLVPDGLEREYYEKPSGDAEHTYADVSKAEREIGYSPTVDLQTGTERAYEWCKEMHENGLLPQQ
jgi:UDP-glucose 4-epimerase